jgi:hypothetical protein
MSNMEHIVVIKAFLGWKVVVTAALSGSGRNHINRRSDAEGEGTEVDRIYCSCLVVSDIQPMTNTNSALGLVRGKS